eukprot:15400489-Alexandrium_andersonii.AAC.1
MADLPTSSCSGHGAPASMAPKSWATTSAAHLGMMASSAGCHPSGPAAVAPAFRKAFCTSS